MYTKMNSNSRMYHIVQQNLMTGLLTNSPKTPILWRCFYIKINKISPGCHGNEVKFHYAKTHTGNNGCYGTNITFHRQKGSYNNSEKKDLRIKFCQKRDG